MAEILSSTDNFLLYESEKQTNNNNTNIAVDNTDNLSLRSLNSIKSNSFISDELSIHTDISDNYSITPSEKRKRFKRLHPNRQKSFNLLLNHSNDQMKTFQLVSCSYNITLLYIYICILKYFLLFYKDDVAPSVVNMASVANLCKELCQTNTGKTPSSKIPVPPNSARRTMNGMGSTPGSAHQLLADGAMSPRVAASLSTISLQQQNRQPSAPEVPSIQTHDNSNHSLLDHPSQDMPMKPFDSIGNNNNVPLQRGYSNPRNSAAAIENSSAQLSTRNITLPGLTKNMHTITTDCTPKSEQTNLSDLSFHDYNHSDGTPRYRVPPLDYSPVAKSSPLPTVTGSNHSKKLPPLLVQHYNTSKDNQSRISIQTLDPMGKSFMECTGSTIRRTSVSKMMVQTTPRPEEFIDDSTLMIISSLSAAAAADHNRIQRPPPSATTNNTNQIPITTYELEHNDYYREMLEGNYEVYYINSRSNSSSSSSLLSTSTTSESNEFGLDGQWSELHPPEITLLQHVAHAPLTTITDDSDEEDDGTIDGHNKSVEPDDVDRESDFKQGRLELNGGNDSCYLSRDDRDDDADVIRQPKGTDSAHESKAHPPNPGDVSFPLMIQSLSKSLQRKVSIPLHAAISVPTSAQPAYTAADSIQEISPIAMASSDITPPADVANVHKMSLVARPQNNKRRLSSNISPRTLRYV